jgi:lariat debranching enzyme
MKIAIEGCCHGELDNIYATLSHLEKENNVKVDLLLICGDFQAVRNEKDLESMAVPEKYRHMQSFYKYYSGEKIAPILTVFIGGNHEASNYLSELPYGGWVAENIYYMGYANVININGIRIAGLSGIYKSQDFYKGHYECPPYSQSSLHSVYHVRNIDTFRLETIKKPIDIMLTHDWPLGIHGYGDTNELLRVKPYFSNDIQNNSLGSPKSEKLLTILKPKYWFSAHLHVKFAAIYPHNDENKSMTKFLALDKCLPRRKFLQVIDIETDQNNSNKLELDLEWLCILKKTDHLLSVSSFMQAPINENNTKIAITSADMDELNEDFQSILTIPNNFKQTAPAYNPSAGPMHDIKNIYLNEQTTLLCEMLNIRDPLRFILETTNSSTLVSQSKTELYNNLLDEDDSETD